MYNIHLLYIIDILSFKILIERVLTEFNKRCKIRTNCCFNDYLRWYTIYTSICRYIARFPKTFMCKMLHIGIENFLLIYVWYRVYVKCMIVFVWVRWVAGAAFRFFSLGSHRNTDWNKRSVHWTPQSQIYRSNLVSLSIHFSQKHFLVG